MNKLHQVLLFYVVLIAALAYYGSTTDYPNGAIWGGVAGAVISYILWVFYGKEYSRKRGDRSEGDDM